MSAKQLLLIDDEPTIQEVVKISLELESDWIILLASSGSEGIKKAEAEQPDAILLDVMMPDMDGIATFEKLRDNSKTQTIPVVFLTAKARTAQEFQPMNLGISGIITKPFNSLQLASQIAKILGWRLKS
ncbi:response regulator [Synechococcus sp. PCC 7336]|uniref:response regulator n=1 Tax=Synechococcus sp. PCC 7336 TaxID=195250 RepID=UPI000344CA36|nr:response regulator [Synechococcus sp. PCC 7336]